MTDNLKISSKQFFALVTLFSIGTAILITPSRLATDAKQDAWIVTLLSIVISLFIIGIYITIANSFKSTTFTQYMEKILGKWIGKIVSLIFSLSALVASSNLFRIFGQFTATQILDDTPIEVIYLLFGSVIFFGVYLGVETLAKSAEIFLPWIVLLFIILTCSLLPHVEIKNISPTLEFGIRPIIKSLISYISIFSLPLVFLLMIFPININKFNSAKKSFYLGGLVAGLVLFILTIMCILVLGNDTTSRSTFPAYVLARRIKLGDFIERIEVILALIWFITIFYKTTFYFYAGILGISQVLNLKNYKFLILPMGMIVITSADIFFPNSVYTDEWDRLVWLPTVIFNGFIIPILLLLVTRIKKIIKNKTSN